VRRQLGMNRKQISGALHEKGLSLYLKALTYRRKLSNVMGDFIFHPHECVPRENLEAEEEGKVNLVIASPEIKLYELLRC